MTIEKLIPSGTMLTSIIGDRSKEEDWDVDSLQQICGWWFAA
jgi:hypothetical protein